MNTLESLSFQLCKVLKTKAEAEEKEKKLRQEIASVMIADRKKEASNDYLSIKYNAPRTRTILDRDALEKRHPEAYLDEACWKTSKVGASITVKMKKGALLV